MYLQLHEDYGDGTTMADNVSYDELERFVKVEASHRCMEEMDREFINDVCNAN